MRPRILLLTWFLGSLLLLEIGAWVLLKSEVIVDIRNSSVPKFFAEIDDGKPRVIPHPYFGYLMTPNHTVVQFAAGNIRTVTYDTNEEGFADASFPQAKQDGACLIGLFGGSGAMSWGETAEEEKLHSLLTKMLNEDQSVQTESCRKFRVLNFGMIDAFQYIATRVFLNYADLLWGAIFYAGVSECWHGTILKTSSPVKYPEIDLDMMVRGYHRQQEINIRAGEVYKILDDANSNWFKKKSHIYLVFSAVRFVRSVKNIRTLHAKILADATFSKNIPKLKGSEFPELRRKFQDIGRMDFADKPMRKFHLEVYRKVLPLIFSRPLADAYAVAKNEGIRFLSIVHPMQEALPRPNHWGKEQYGLASYRAPCNEVLLNESEALKKRYGFDTANFNEKKLFLSSKDDIFTDGTHLTPEGSRIVANHIYALMKEKWLKE